MPVLRLQSSDEQDAEAVAQVPGATPYLRRAARQARSAERIRRWLRGG